MSPIIAQYRAPFVKKHPLRCFFVMKTKAFIQSDFDGFENSNFS